jgi:hypothetical protein
MFAKTSIAFAALAAVANAHMLMSNPAPYGAASLSNSPLEANGSDFPCKQRSGVYEKGSASNVYEQGSKQTLKVKGGATHGGGSCQISVTTDTEPTKDSVWKVIHSIEGGCPARNAAGNIGNSAEADAPDGYDFTIPKDLPAGEYALAWTWFNKIGNREMYMNCAPVTITGSGGSADALAALPDMFVANIGNGCSVSEGSDVEFPNPGDSIARENGATNVFAAPQGACATGSSKPGPVQPGPKPTDAPTEPAQPTEAPSKPSKPTETPGGVFVPAPIENPVKATETPVAPAPPTTPTQAPAPPSEPVEAPSPSPAEPTKAPSPPPSAPSAPAAPIQGGQSGPCTQEGKWNCVGGKSFQRCASGAWSALQPVADGTTCTDGMSDTFEMGVKRSYPVRV